MSGMVPRVDGAEAEYRRGVQPAEVGVRETRRLPLFGELGIQTAGAGAKLLEEGVPVERDSAGPNSAPSEMMLAATFIRSSARVK